MSNDRPYAVNASYFVFALDGKLRYKTFGDIESTPKELATPGFSSFSLLTLTKNDVLYCVASGPKRAQSLLRVDLKSNEVKF